MSCRGRQERPGPEVTHHIETDPRYVNQLSQNQPQVADRKLMNSQIERRTRIERLPTQSSRLKPACTTLQEKAMLSNECLPETTRNGTMTKRTILRLLWALLVGLGGVVAAGSAQADSSRVDNVAPPPVALAILVRQPEEALVRYAGEELQRYVRRLFGFHPPSYLQELKTRARTVIVLGGPDESLSSQEYVIRPIRHEGAPALLVAGGSPRATLWAAYEVVSAWGVRFLVQDDVFPESAGPFGLPDLNVKRQPVFPRIPHP